MLTEQAIILFKMWIGICQKYAQKHSFNTSQNKSFLGILDHNLDFWYFWQQFSFPYLAEFQIKLCALQ